MNQPLFGSTQLVQRIEQAGARLVATASAAARRRRGDNTGFAVQIAGGVASFAEQNSPFNKVAGIGFAGPPAAEDLDGIERAFAACGRRRRLSWPTSPTRRSEHC